MTSSTHLSLIVAIALVLVGCSATPTIRTLTPDIIAFSSVARGQYTYFRVDATAHADAKPHLTVSVTPLTEGDPDLYASWHSSVRFPNASSGFHDAQAVGFGQDTITVSGDEYAGEQYVYFSVYGWRPVGNFTIVASFEGTIQLDDGIPQMGSVAYEQTMFYEFMLPDGDHTDITITATPVVGNPRVIVSTGGRPNMHTRSNWYWYTPPRSTGEALYIRRSDPHWPSGDGLFYIAVYGTTASDFTVLAVTDQSSSLLVDGRSQQSHAETGETEYFKVELPPSPADEPCSLSIIVTPLTGDPDVYVSKLHRHPSPTDSEWHSTAAFGEDQVDIDDAASTTASTTYYIGVSAYDNSTFTIVALISCGEDDHEWIQLVDGQPQSGELQRHTWAYYKLRVASGHPDLSVSVSRRFGDPDIYMTTSEFNDGALPTREAGGFLWRSISWGEDLLTVQHDSANWCTHCEYIIGVYASSHCAYSIVASTKLLTLQVGVPFRENLRRGQYEYFQLPVDTHNQDLTVTVTDLAQGDPDLFISRIYQFPNHTHNEWRAQRLRGDSITIAHDEVHACANCMYYISVYAAQNSTFTILATFDSPARLQDGVPQQGTVLKGARKFYEVQVRDADHKDLTITVTTLGGLANLYVSTDRNPGPTDYMWMSSWFTSQKSIQITQQDPNRCRDEECRYHIAVHGFTSANYSIVAATDMSTIPLQNGIPQLEHVEQGGWEYFSMRIDNLGRDLSFVVTPITGDPDLYCSSPSSPTYTARPNSTTADRIKTTYGGDIVDYDQAVIGNYYCGVNAYTNSTFTINAIVTSADSDPRDNVVLLQDGSPQTGFVHKSDFRYYQFELGPQQGGRKLEFKLTKSYGDPDLYVSLGEESFPTRNDADWSSNDFREDIVSIADATPGVYTVGVFGYSTAEYTLTASTDQIITQLSDSVPVQGDLGSGEYNYYEMTFDQFERDITITITPYSGSPWLFVSSDPDVPRPNITNYDWAAVDYRGDTVVIPASDPNACKERPRCSYYISVYAFTPSSYRLVAVFSEPTALSAGRPQNGYVPRHGFAYYTARVFDGHRDLTVTVTPQDGEPQVFIQPCNVVQIELCQRPQLFPEPIYTWRSDDEEVFTGDPIVIRHTDPNFCHGSDCIYYIGVYGRTPANFTITATTSDSNIELLDGVPQRAWLDTGKWAYFLFYLGEEHKTVEFTLTPITGDPDIYVSNRYVAPNKTHYDWQSMFWGGDVVVVNNAEPGYYYIGVTAFLNSTFTVTAYIENDDDVRKTVHLTNGIPQDGYVAQGQFRYYEIILENQHEDLEVTVTRRAGDPDLYMLRGDRRPMLNDSQWHSDTFGEDLIAVHRPQRGHYVIGVYGYTNAMFTIAATTGDRLLTLLDGIPFREDLFAGEYEYFKMFVDRTDMDLTITVTSFSGDPDLFVSTRYQRPNITHHDISARAYLEDSITIPHSQLQYGTNYFVSVNAYTNCTFTIVATFMGDTLLQDGVAQSGTIHRGAQQFFRFHVDGDHTDITFTLTPITGNAWLYVSNDVNVEPDRHNSSTYQWHSTNFAATQNIIIESTDANFRGSASYSIMVYGRSTSNFTLTASTSQSTIALQSGLGVRSRSQAGHYQYFLFEVGNTRSDVQISVTPVTGDPDLFVSTYYERPTFQTAELRSQNWGADAITIAHDSPFFKLGVYYIGVYAFTNSTFIITAEASASNDTIVMINGIPQVNELSSTVTVDHYRFYVAGHNGARFTLSARFGDPDMYITNDGTTPGRNNYIWAGRSFGRDQVTILPSDAHYCQSCWYNVAVTAFITPVLYSLTGQLMGSIVLLEAGVPVLERLSWGTYSYFHFIVDESNTEVVISATAVSGDPDLYITDWNSNVHFPNTTHWDHRSIMWGSDTYSIPNAHPGDYWISVYAATENTTFTLTATISAGDNHAAVTLADGVPQEDSIDAATGSRLYAFHVNDPNLERDITLTLTPIDGGSGEMYVLQDMDGSRPTPTHFNFSTETSPSPIRNVLVIPAAQSCRSCTFLLLITSTTNLHYTISFQTGADDTYLVAGKPVQGHVVRHHYQYYRFVVDRNDRPIRFLLTTFSGDADLYVSRETPHPDTTHWTWRSMSIHNDSIEIMPGDAHFGSGIYYVGVRGYRNSTYSLTATIGNVQIAPGSPLQDTSQRGGNFYTFSLDSQDTSDVITFQISAGSATTVDLYADNRREGRQPGPDHYLRHENFALSSTPKTFTIDTNGATEWYFGVYMTEPGTVFTVIVSTSDSVAILRDNSQVSGRVQRDSFRYYDLPIQAADNFSIVLEPCVGDTDLYFRDHHLQPTRNDYSFRSTSDNSIDIIEVSTPVRSSYFVVGVYSKSVNHDAMAEFNLYSHLSSAPYSAPALSSRAIDVVDVTDTSLTIAFQAATNPGVIKYDVYFALGDSPAIMYSNCGLARTTFVTTVTGGTGKIQVEIPGLQKETNYRINVVARDEHDVTTLFQDRPVRTAAEPGDGGGDGGLPINLLLGVGIPLFIIIVSTIVYLCVRNRKLTKELDVEMHDVPKSAVLKAVRGPQGRAEGPKKYSRLLEDDDDEDGVGTTYDPPEV